MYQLVGVYEPLSFLFIDRLPVLVCRLERPEMIWRLSSSLELEADISAVYMHGLENKVRSLGNYNCSSRASEALSRVPHYQLRRS